jgi:hypothetical protein
MDKIRTETFYGIVRDRTPIMWCVHGVLDDGTVDRRVWNERMSDYGSFDVLTPAEWSMLELLARMSGIQIVKVEAN